MKSPAAIERTKLSANLLNGLAVGTILSAFVTPYIGIGLGTLTPKVNWLNLAGLSTFGLVLGGILHLIGLDILSNLED